MKPRRPRSNNRSSYSVQNWPDGVAQGSSPVVEIHCSQGGCVLTCSRCGVLDQGDRPSALARMRVGKTAHEVEHEPAHRAARTSAQQGTDTGGPQ